MSARFPMQQDTPRREVRTIAEQMHRRAYEVYSACNSPQESLLDPTTCRGGFGSGELIAYLYAYPFPRSEWKARVNEVFAGWKR
jgi:hypothetical protein